MLRELSVAEQRYQAVLAVIEDGLPVTEAAAKFGVTPADAACVAVPLCRAAGWRRWPIGRIGRGRVRIRWLRRSRCGWSSCAGCIRAGGRIGCVYRLGREGVEPVPSRAAIGRALARLGLVGPGRRRGRRREYRRWERGRPMELWQLDVMGGVLLDDGAECKVVTAIDDHSRFCLAVGLVERATSRPVCGVFARILEEFGAPEEVLTDNGKVFTGRFASGRSRCSSTGSAGRTASGTC